jgi:hypothetical protein
LLLLKECATIDKVVRKESLIKNKRCKEIKKIAMKERKL